VAAGAKSEDLIVCAVSLGKNFDSLEGFFGAEELGEKVSALWDSINKHISTRSGELLSGPVETIRAVWPPEHSAQASKCALELVSGLWHASRDKGYFRSAGIARGICTVDMVRGRRSTVIGGAVNDAMKLACHPTLKVDRVYATTEIATNIDQLRAQLVTQEGLVTSTGRKDIFEIHSPG
jgi:hypothetical protein